MLIISFSSEIHLLSTGAISPCKDLVVLCEENENNNFSIRQVDINR